MTFMPSRPVLPSQRRLFINHRLAPDALADNVLLAWQLAGPLDRSALRAAFNRIVERHAPLRATFEPDEHGEPQQFVRASLEVALPITELNGVLEADREAELEAFLAVEARRPFDLSVGPLVRTGLVVLSPRENVYFLAMHHIITDGWSASVIVNELNALYAGELTGAALDNGLQTVDYERVIPEHLAWLHGRDLGGQLGFWRRELDGLEPVHLPTDLVRGPGRTSTAANVLTELDHDTLNALRVLARRNKCTLHVVLIAICQLLLARHTGQPDVALSTVSSGRKRLELERVVGFFVNTVVLRGHVDGSQNFTDLLAQTRSRLFDALRHEDVPFDHVVADLPTTPAPGQVPLAAVNVVLQNTPPTPLELAGIQAVEIDVPIPESEFDLTFEFRERHDRLALRIIYRSDLFAAARIEWMTSHIRRIVEFVVEQPSRLLHHLDILAEEEHSRLTELGRGAAIEPLNERVHELVALQASARPEAPAVVHEGRSLTYRRLDAKANQLAHHLRHRGVGSGDVVALLLDRGQHLVVSLLAVAKCGAAFLPLDPAYPDDRLNYLLADSRAVLVVTESDRSGIVDERYPSVLLDRDEPVIEGRPMSAPDVKVLPNDLAYVIYTSGSTGLPKGVLVEHRSLSNVVAEATRHLALGPDSRVLQLFSPAFDGALWEMLPTLVVGATLCLASRRVAENPLLVAEQCERDRITVATMTPSVLRHLDPDRFPSLQVVASAGESCPPEIADAWSRRVTFINAYGPTEAAIGVSVHRTIPDHRYHRVPIGTPLANCGLHILDDHQRLVPYGVIGELYISGTQVARGYHRRPELTKDSFLKVRLPGMPSLRMYRTGDLARWNPDGHLEYVGRVDAQVKVRGYRIEPAEIESVLIRHPAVASAFVVLSQTSTLPRLLAYVVPSSPGKDLDQAEMRRYLRESLPAHMIPSFLVPTAEFPRLASGKMDVRALPEPRELDPAGGEYQPPRDAQEQVLAQIWSEVLGVNLISRDVAFGDLGGDSIMTMEVMARAKRRGITVAAQEMTSRQTIAGLAAALEQDKPSGPLADASATVAGLHPMQLWFLTSQASSPDLFNQSIHLELVDRVRPSLLEEALRCVVSHHGALRTHFSKDADGWWQKPSRRVEESILETVDLSRIAPVDVGRAMEQAACAAQSGLSLAQGPVFGAVLFDFGPGGRRARLFLTAHHLAVDGVSWRIIVNDLALAYRQISSGQDPDLGAGSTPYIKWVNAMTRYTREGGFDNQTEFWRSIEEEVRSVGDVARDKSGPVTARRLRAEARTMSARTLAGLARLPGLSGQAVSRTADVVLAAVARALAKRTRGEAVAITVEGHGREDVLAGHDLSQTVGWFTSTFPVCLPVSSDSDAHEAVNTVLQRLAEIPQKGIGYNWLRYVKATPDSRARTVDGASPEVSFNFLGSFDAMVRDRTFWSGLRRQLGVDYVFSAGSAPLLEFEAAIVSGRLWISCRYPSDLFHPTTIDALLQEVISFLSEITSEQ